MAIRLTAFRVLICLCISCFWLFGAGLVGPWQLTVTATQHEQNESAPKRSDVEGSSGGQGSETKIASLHKVITNYCIDCHGSDSPEGDLDLDSVLGQDIAWNTATWERVLRKVHSRQMPPSGEPRPKQDVIDEAMKHLTTALDAAATIRPQPGRTSTFRRLNRIEYQNAIRDLLDWTLTRQSSFLRTNPVTVLTT
jgi:mono/diheme cytochrome c family protein